jgi:hypothetical protein
VQAGRGGTRLAACHLQGEAGAGGVGGLDVEAARPSGERPADAGAGVCPGGVLPQGVEELAGQSQHDVSNVITAAIALTGPGHPRHPARLLRPAIQAGRTGDLRLLGMSGGAVLLNYP